MNPDDVVERCREIVSKYEKEGATALENLNFSSHEFDVLLCFFEKDEIGYKKIQEQKIIGFLDKGLFEISGSNTYYHFLINSLTNRFIASNFGITVIEVLDIYDRILGESILYELEYFLSKWIKKFSSKEYNYILLEIARKKKQKLKQRKLNKFR